MNKVELTDELESEEINGSEYTRVKTRVMHLAKNFKYEIETISEFIEPLGAWKVKAVLVVYDEHGKVLRKTSGSACEVIGSSEINETNALENAETSAIGRACGFAGIGLTKDIASFDEVSGANEKIKTVKSERSKTAAKTAEEKALEKLTRNIKK